MNRDELDAWRQIEYGARDMRKLLEERDRDARRAAFVRRLGIRTPKWLYGARQAMLEPRWTGKERWYHSAARRVCEWWLDRFEMLVAFGRLW